MRKVLDLAVREIFRAGGLAVTQLVRRRFRHEDTARAIKLLDTASERLRTLIVEK